MTSPLVAVVGDGLLPPGDPREAFAFAVGRGIADRGWRLVTGGRGGVMAAASAGARSSPAWVPGTVIGLLPGSDPAQANPHVDVAIPTGLGHGRNLLVARSDAVIAIGGGAGTLSEIAFAWIHDRLIVARRGEGWSGRLADQRVDERIRRPALPEDRVFGADTADEALAIVARELPRYPR